MAVLILIHLSAIVSIVVSGSMPLLFYIAADPYDLEGGE